jgi:hypothetical protein
MSPHEQGFDFLPIPAGAHVLIIQPGGKVLAALMSAWAV